MFRTIGVLLGLSLLIGVPAAAQAPTVSIQFQNGYVSLQARNAPLRTILNEWARTGRTTIVNGDRVAGAPLTLELTNVPEREALATLLRSVAGYIVGARQVASTGPSAFDRIMIVPTSSVAPAPARVFTNTPSAAPGPAAPQPPPPPPPVAFVPGDPDEPGAPESGPNRILTAQQLQQQLNARAAAARAAEQAEENDAVRQATPPARTPANPIFSGPSGRPGEIAPVPQQPRNPLRPNGDPEP